jgi:large subunit ribosomal protein L5
MKQRYAEIAVPALKQEFGYTNVNAIPRITKVVISAGVGRAVRDVKELDVVTDSLRRMTGQKPVQTKSKKSIANFKLREGMPIGVMVTLRGHHMQDFLEKLVHVALPRVRDFQGIPLTSFSVGTYTIGFKEHLMFPEIPSESVEKIHGLAVTIVTSAQSPAEAKTLLKSLGFPFRIS